VTGRAFNLADLFEVVVDTVPDRPALVAGDVRLTYGELDARANRLAHHLLDAGIRPGDKVAIDAWNRAEWIEAELGIYKARAVPVNVNYRYVADEARHILDNSDAVAVIFERSLGPILASVRADLPQVRHWVVLEDGSEEPFDGAVAYEDALAAASPARDFDPRSADDLYLLYTGGTTGMPKGVMWRAEDIFFAALGGGGFGQPPIGTPEELAERVTPEATRTISLVNAPMMHGGGQWSSFITFFSGGTVVLNTMHHFDPGKALRMIERERCNSTMVVGDAMGRPLAEALAAPGASYDISSLVVVGSGGAILSPAVKEQLRTYLPNVMVIDSFGASETGAGGSVLDQDAAAGPRFTMGPFMSVLGDDLRPVAAGSGTTGRLARSGHIPLGYFKDEEKTAATFFTDPDGKRWVIPGDFARIEADGAITVLGRGSVCINTGGEKVFPEEVEATLKSHPDVFDSVVVGVPDDRFVERVAAIVQPRSGATPALPALQEHCRAQLAGFKVPRQLVVLDEIVRTPVGKPDYRWAKRIATNTEGER
jgi:fatty-acyl-CoA synthase